MAQLREAISSELVAEGTPEELVLIAQELSSEVIYDGVGDGFDPVVVLENYNKRLEGLNGALDDPDTSDDLKPDIESAIAEIEAIQPDSGQVREVQATIDEARSRVEEA